MNVSSGVIVSECSIDEYDVLCKTIDFQNDLKWYFYDSGKPKISSETETACLTIGSESSDRATTGIVYPNTEVSFIFYDFLLTFADFNFDDVGSFPICHLRDVNGLSVHGQLVKNLPCSVLVNIGDNVGKSDELHCARLKD